MNSTIWRDLLVSRPQAESEAKITDPDDRWRDNVALGVLMLVAGAAVLALAGLGVIR